MGTNNKKHDLPATDAMTGCAAEYHVYQLLYMFANPDEIYSGNGSPHYSPLWPLKEIMKIFGFGR